MLVGFSLRLPRIATYCTRSPTGKPSAGDCRSSVCIFAAFLQYLAMQATISVSGRGLIALPAEMRKEAGIRPQDSLIAETTPEGILLRPALTLPVEIYTPERVAEFDSAEAELAQVMNETGAK
jgi:bifunctional DNA-binding transcriptional regulator/antitoxin component of YhaV-PrlF toxin-antitoxin module